jgi:hypothetical protein
MGATGLLDGNVGSEGSVIGGRLGTLTLGTVTGNDGNDGGGKEGSETPGIGVFALPPLRVVVIGAVRTVTTLGAELVGATEGTVGIVVGRLTLGRLGSEGVGIPGTVRARALPAVAMPAMASAKVAPATQAARLAGRADERGWVVELTETSGVLGDCRRGPDWGGPGVVWVTLRGVGRLLPRLTAS